MRTLLIKLNILMSHNLLSCNNARILLLISKFKWERCNQSRLLCDFKADDFDGKDNLFAFLMMKSLKKLPYRGLLGGLLSSRVDTNFAEFFRRVGSVI
jgi:hypothetical protein